MGLEPTTYGSEDHRSNHWAKGAEQRIGFQINKGWRRARRAEALVALTVRIMKSPATQNRTRNHMIAAVIYSQMLYQLSYSRRCPFRNQ